VAWHFPASGTVLILTGQARSDGAVISWTVIVWLTEVDVFPAQSIADQVLVTLPVPHGPREPLSVELRVVAEQSDTVGGSQGSAWPFRQSLRSLVGCDQPGLGVSPTAIVWSQMAC